MFKFILKRETSYYYYLNINSPRACILKIINVLTETVDILNKKITLVQTIHYS